MCGYLPTRSIFSTGAALRAFMFSGWRRRPDFLVDFVERRPFFFFFEVSHGILGLLVHIFSGHPEIPLSPTSIFSGVPTLRRHESAKASASELKTRRHITADLNPGVGGWVASGVIPRFSACYGNLAPPLITTYLFPYLDMSANHSEDGFRDILAQKLWRL